LNEERRLFTAFHNRKNNYRARKKLDFPMNRPLVMGVRLGIKLVGGSVSSNMQIDDNVALMPSEDMFKIRLDKSKAQEGCREVRVVVSSERVSSSSEPAEVAE